MGKVTKKHVGRRVRLLANSELRGTFMEELEGVVVSVGGEGEFRFQEDGLQRPWDFTTWWWRVVEVIG